MYLEILFSFNFKSSVLIAFVFHGILFSILLFIKWREHKSQEKLWLSIFTFLSTLYILPFALGYAGWYSRNPYRDILLFAPLQHVLLIPPVLYFYLKAMLDKNFLFLKRDWWHFVPGICYLVYTITILIIDKFILEQPFFYHDGRDKDMSFWYQVAGFISFILYCVMALKHYLRYRLNTYQVSSSAEQLLLSWVHQFLIALLILLLIRGIFFITNPEWFEFGRKFWYYLFFAGLLYFISFKGYINNIKSGVSTEELVFSLEDFVKEKEPLVREHISIDQKAELTLWKNTIENLLSKEKLYEKPDLNLTELASKIGIPEKKCSQYINQGFGMNFNDFVNRSRVLSVIEKMKAGEHSYQNLLGLAYESGFNSKSTFNRAFKKFTGATPKEYLQQNQL